MIILVDYGVGNFRSVVNMLKHVGVECQSTSDLRAVAKADKLILPGVGAFDTAMRRIEESGLRPVLEQKALVEKVPVLGICLGMQLFTESSEEGALPGLGWIPAKTVAFKGRVDAHLKIPHMGWNLVTVPTASPLTTGLAEMEEPRFYFVHSYFVRCEDERAGILTTTYGLTYVSGIQRENIFGVQCHPEKSHRFGMKLLENFARL